MSNPVAIGFLIFPGMLQLDCTGPFAVFAQAPDARLHLVARTRQPIVSSDGLVFQPTTGMDEAPHLDILVVPGGEGVSTLLSDGEALSFIRRTAAAARYSTSVCTGALVLGAAGLLRGRRATTHWQSLDLLAHFGAVPVRERIVFDDAVVTAAGVTAGIDMALALVGRVWDDVTAQTIQLAMEYSPRPPYDCGDAESAPRTIRQALEAKRAARRQARTEAVLRAAHALGAQ